MSQRITVLHCTENGSNKIWAYDPNLNLSFYGRWGSKLTQKAVDFQNAQKRIREKIDKKGYVDVSNEFTIVDGALVSKAMESQSNDEWLFSFNAGVTGDDVAEYLWNLTAPEFSQQISELITLARNEKKSLSLPKPKDVATRLVIASILNRYPNCDLYDDSNNAISTHQLLSNRGTRDELIALKLIQDIKTFKTPESKDDGAYF